MKKTFKRRLAAVFAAVLAAACLPSGLTAIRAKEEAKSDAKAERIGTVGDAQINQTSVWVRGGQNEESVRSAKRCMPRQRICLIRTSFPWTMGMWLMVPWRRGLPLRNLKG